MYTIAAKLVYRMPSRMTCRIYCVVLIAANLLPMSLRAESKSPTDLFAADYLHPSNIILPSNKGFCGAYCVWYALRWLKQPASMDAICDELGVKQRSGTSIADLVKVLNKHGVAAEPVSVKTHQITSVNDPFIMLMPESTSELYKGHFIFVAPMGNGKAIAADGPDKPNLFSMSTFTAAGKKKSLDIPIILLPRQAGTRFAWPRGVGRIAQVTFLAVGLFSAYCLLRRTRCAQSRR